MKKLPDDIAGPLRDFVAVSGEIRLILADATPSVPTNFGLPMDAIQTYISAIDTLSAACRPHVAPIVDKVGRSPALHFVSTVYAPEGFAVVTKNDRLIWTGPIRSMIAAMTAGGWPGGSTVHLSPLDYAMVVQAMQDTHEQEGNAP